ncbi:A/G-specific adenine glycosylase [Planctomicrobium sp. SH668]|uniref:A/G-specific adenine glycosylase n=1 Tax=Planctomicrobium sp. SH668 TaxID=3448126 RepID=UPI003F5C3694
MSLDLLEIFDANRCRDLRKSLGKWYLREGRSLPWREKTDPYEIWISEIMLQQTTVKAVIPYYERFLSRFPTVFDLAAASESEVLQYWEGLGYYSRGRNLRLAAQRVCEEFGGVFPSDLAELQSLPGIGRYTAGAIRSFGFDLPAPIVEANTLRLYCRLLGFSGDPRGKEGQKILWALAERLQPSKVAGHLNQALMELGATVCTPTSPKCEECPVVQFCEAFRQGIQAEIPVKQSRPVVTQVVEATVAVQCQGKWLVRFRNAEQRWAGMWDFPRFSISVVGSQEKLTPSKLAAVVEQAGEELFKASGLRIEQLEEVMQTRHTVTRFRIRLLCFSASLSASDSRELQGEGWRWATNEEIESLPMPVTGRTFFERLTSSR